MTPGPEIGAGPALHAKFLRLDGEPGAGPWFDGDRFSLVDVAFGPVFRYFDVFDTIGAFDVFTGLTRVMAWRSRLGRRDSVRTAVTGDYRTLLCDFLGRRNSCLSRIMQTKELKNPAKSAFPTKG